MSDIDPADEDALKRLIYWDNIDCTVRGSVSEFAYRARGVLLPQFTGSEEERSDLQRAIDGLEPAIDSIINRLATLKSSRPAIYKSILQELHGLLCAYAMIGVNHAFTEVVERIALEPVRAQRSKAGKTSAKLRAATMTEPWHLVFDPIVQRLRTERPSLRDAPLIREARKAYGNQVPHLPSDRQLTTHVNDLVASGKLPAGLKDGRGRRVMK